MATYYVAGIPYSATLSHHGIKGQKWGIRRYQNEDGTLTPAGMERYGAKNQRQAQKLMKYQEKEYAKAKTAQDQEAAYNKNRRTRLLQKKADAKASGNQKKEERMSTKISKLDSRWKERKAVTDRVLENIQNMTVSDMNRENMLRGAAVAGTVLSMFGGMYMAETTGFGAVAVLSPSGMVESNRTSRAYKEIKAQKT